MSKKSNDFKNRSVQKYIKQAKKELKAEGLLTDNEFTNLVKVITRAYVIYATERLAKHLVKSVLKIKLHLKEKMKNNWFIKKKDNVEIEEIEDVSSLAKEIEPSPLFTKDKISLIYRYTVVNQHIVKTEIKVKRENNES